MRRTYNVLFLCTGNSARSIMAERLMEHRGAGRFRAFSAGSYPKGAVHPLALRLLAEQSLPTEGLRSKSWDEFAAPGAPEMDFIFTTCDEAANEVCPVWPGHPMTAHWGVPDPAAVEGDEVRRAFAFREAFAVLDRRIRIFTALKVEALDRLALRREVEAIGRDAMGAREDAR
jgi:arsenate reductase (thioredoxin)